MQLNNFSPTTDKPLEGLKQGINAVNLPQSPNNPEIPRFPSSFCDGSSQSWQLRPGLSLIIHNLKFREKAIVTQGNADGTITLGMSFCLAGHIQGRSANSEKAIQLQTGQASLGVLNGTSRIIEYAARRLLLVHLHVQPKAIGLANKEILDQLPRSLRMAMTQQRPTDYFRSHTMTTVMSQAVQQLLDCPYHGLSQRLYLESKAIELISLYFAQLSPESGSRPSSDSSSRLSSGLKGEDVDRIFYARDVLLSQVSNPPTLIELARQIGLNDRKLKEGFRQVFGTTVFGYLHQYRMQQAQHLLLMPRATIASVAQKIGYSNPEAFSVAFRRSFEISPKAYQMKQR